MGQHPTNGQEKTRPNKGSLAYKYRVEASRLGEASVLLSPTCVSALNPNAAIFV